MHDVSAFLSVKEDEIIFIKSTHACAIHIVVFNRQICPLYSS